MNANELADELENGAKLAEDHATIAIRVTKAATMLHQQQAEIGFYKQDADKYKQKCASQQAEIEALKKELDTCKTIVALSNIAWKNKFGDDK